MAAPIRWLKSYWDEEDILFFFEVNADSWVLRQIELSGPTRTPTTAAALDETLAARDESLKAMQKYEAKYGRIADQPITCWDPDFPREEISQEDFEKTWVAARSHLEL